MLHWVEQMALHGGGGPVITYGTPLFRWLKDHLLMVEDYAYDDTYFYEDIDLALLEGEQWSDLGKK